MSLALKEGFSHLCTCPEPDWSALGCNEVPITGGNQGELLNRAQEAVCVCVCVCEGGGGEDWSRKIPKHPSF